MAISFEQLPPRQRSDDVGVTALIAEVIENIEVQPAGFLQTFVERRPRKGGEQSDHCSRNAGFCNEVDLLVENILCIAVEPDDESRIHEQAGVLYGMHGLDERPLRVLEFQSFFQTFYGR